MRLTCAQKDLVNALSITSKAVAMNNTLPVLNNILVKAEGKKLYFTSTNLELAIQYWIEADIKNEGEITIPAKLLTSYVGYLKDGELDMTVEEGGDVLIQSGKSKTKIKGIASSEFPSVPLVDREAGFKISGKDLQTAIQQVSFAAALNTTRPILTGIYFWLDEGKLKMVATDSYRLAEKVLPATDISGELSCIVPAKTIMELGAILSLSKETEVIEVIVSKNQIFFTIGKTQVTSRLIEGQFPNYQQVIPQESKLDIALEVSTLALTLKRINLFAKENNSKVLLQVKERELLITTESTQYGVGEEKIVVEVEGEGRIALNSQFMLDVLGNLNSKEVLLKIGDETKPALFTSKDSQGYVHIIMPLKI